MKVAEQLRAQSIIIMLVITASTFAARCAAQSVDEALRNLHHTQAKAIDWEGLQPGSMVTYIRVGKSRVAGDYREKVTQVMTARTPTNLKFEMILKSGERTPWFPANVDAEELAATNAEKTGEEDVFIGNRKLHAVIYHFSYDKFGTSYEETYWLASEGPDGV